MQIFTVKGEQYVSSDSPLTLDEHLEETVTSAKPCKSRTQISSKLSAWLSMGCVYSHAFICHLLLIYRILYCSLVLFISHKTATLNLIRLKILHPSPPLCFWVIIRYFVRIQLRLFEKNGTNSVVVYEPLQHICSWVFSPPAWLQCTVGYSTKMKGGISTLITILSSLIYNVTFLVLT